MNLHAAARIARSASAHLPEDPASAVAAVRQEAANAVVQTIGPLVERGGRRLVEAIRKKISGNK